MNKQIFATLALLLAVASATNLWEKMLLTEDNDTNCVICQSQCIDLDSTLYKMQADESLISFRYAIISACHYGPNIDYLLEELSVAQANMDIFYNFTNEAYNQPTTGVLWEILGDGVKEIENHYINYTITVNEIRARVQSDQLCQVLKPFFDDILALINFIGYALVNEDKASLIEDKCGFEPCSVLANINDELSNIEFPDKIDPPFPSSEGLLLMIEQLQHAINVPNTAVQVLVNPINTILDTTYTKTVNGTKYTKTGKEIVYAWDESIRTMFHDVIDEVKGIIKHNMVTVKSLVDSQISRVVDFVEDSYYFDDSREYPSSGVEEIDDLVECEAKLQRKRNGIEKFMQIIA